MFLQSSIQVEDQQISKTGRNSTVHAGKLKYSLITQLNDSLTFIKSLADTVLLNWKQANLYHCNIQER